MTTMSSKPCRLSSSMMCSMHGLPTIGTIGFGWFDVSGRRRVPSPPAMTTAFIASALSSRRARRTSPRARTARARSRRARAATSCRPRTDPEADAGVEHPRRGLAEHVDVEVDAARREHAPADEQQEVAQRRSRRAPAHGSRPYATSRITAASISSRSASGSAILPKRDSTCQRRARKPSTWSVAPAAPKRIAAGQLCPPPACTIRATKTGITSRRAIVSAFGSCASGAGTARVAIPDKSTTGTSRSWARVEPRRPVRRCASRYAVWAAAPKRPQAPSYEA